MPNCSMSASFEMSNGTKNYEKLENKPSINGVELVGNKTSAELGLATSAQGALAESALQEVPSYYITETELASELSTKQNVINDLSEIREGASLGATSVQPDDISDMATKEWIAEQGYTSNAVKSVNGNLPDTSGNVVITVPSQVNADWNATSGVAEILNKPTIPTDTGDLTNNAGYIKGISGTDVTNALGYVPYNSSNPNNYITSSALNGYATENWVVQQDYLTGITGSQVTNALGYTPVNPSNLSDVATSGSYNDLENKPTIGNGTVTFTQGGVNKGSITMNQSGNATIALDSGGGSITVDDELSTTSENPVQNKVITNALNDKQDELVAGKNIKIVEGAEIVVPSGYQQLNYIHASSEAMIKTGITGSVQWELGAKSYVNRAAKFLVSNTNATTNALWFGQTTYYWGCGARTTVNATEKADIVVNFNLETNNVNGTVNGVSFTYTKSGTAVGEWVLFGSPDGNTTRLFDGELYYARAKQNGVVVFNGVPVMKLSEGDVGLYDTVSGEFFNSDTAGYFWEGDNVYEKDSILAALPENNLALNVYGMPKANFQVGGVSVNADISPTVLPKEFTVSPLSNSSVVKPLYSLLFCGDDNLIYSHNDTTVPISLQYGMFTNNREFVANSAPNWYNKCERCAWVVPDSLRTIQAKQKVYARCTYPDSNGDVYFVDVVGQDNNTNALAGGYTYFYLGVASTATYVAFDTTGSHFLSIDSNGYLTHINGLRIST